MFETVSDLIKAFRDEEKDAIAPYFWSDGMLLRFVNAALTVFSERTMCLIDEQVFDAAQGERYIEYPHYILDVLGASIEIGGRVFSLNVRPISEASVNNAFGLPRHLFIGGSSAQAMLYPTPNSEARVYLRIARLPIKPVEKESRLTDIPFRHREHLLAFVKHKAYGVKDSEVFDGAKSEDFLAEFYRGCRSAYESELRRRGDARKIRYGGPT